MKGYANNRVLTVFGRYPFNVDSLFLVLVIGLILLGYVMMCSASLHLGAARGDIFIFPKQQLIHIGLGLFAALVVTVIPIEFWSRVDRGLLVIGLILLGLVLIPGLGVEVNGSVRWLAVAGFRLQISELVKLIAVIFMAGYLSRHIDEVRGSANGIIRPLIVLSVACALMLMEPDFGASAVMLATALTMMFIAGARLWPFAFLALILAVIGGLVIYTSDYRLSRVLIFLDPWGDPTDKGWQLVQAQIAFGRGEWFGVGLGSSVGKLFYLPEAHTDFLFSVLGEELGFAGVSSVIIMFSMLVWRAFQIGARAGACGLCFASYLAFGMAIWFGLQAFINMGVNLGLLPTKGLTLPLMSYGGASIIVMFSAVGMLCRVHHETVLASRRNTPLEAQS